MTGRWWLRLLSVWLVALRDAEGTEPVADAGTTDISERYQAEFGQEPTFASVGFPVGSTKRLQPVLVF